MRRAAKLAKAFSSALHVVSAYGTEGTPEAALTPPDLGYWIRDLGVEVEAMLARVAEELVADGVKVETHAAFGHPVHVIVDVARTQGADLDVVGNKGMQAPMRIIGSVPNSIAHRAPCDVVIVHTT